MKLWKLTAAPVTLAAAAGFAWVYWNTPAPHVTVADVQAYLRAHEMADQVRHFHEWEWNHPDIPRTIVFPEIATDPVLWDFTLHTVLRGDKQTWSWGSYAYFVPVSGISTAITAASTTTMGIASCYQPSYQNYISYPQPALSGGHP